MGKPTPEQTIQMLKIRYGELSLANVALQEQSAAMHEKYIAENGKLRAELESLRPQGGTTAAAQITETSLQT